MVGARPACPCSSSPPPTSLQAGAHLCRTMARSPPAARTPCMTPAMRCSRAAMAPAFAWKRSEWASRPRSSTVERSMAGTAWEHLHGTGCRGVHQRVGGRGSPRAGAAVADWAACGKTLMWRDVHGVGKTKPPTHLVPAQAPVEHDVLRRACNHVACRACLRILLQLASVGICATSARRGARTQSTGSFVSFCRSFQDVQRASNSTATVHARVKAVAARLPSTAREDMHFLWSPLQSLPNAPQPVKLIRAGIAPRPTPACIGRRACRPDKQHGRCRQGC